MFNTSNVQRFYFKNKPIYELVFDEPVGYLYLEVEETVAVRQPGWDLLGDPEFRAQ